MMQKKKTAKESTKENMETLSVLGKTVKHRAVEKGITIIKAWSLNYSTHNINNIKYNQYGGRHL